MSVNSRIKERRESLNMSRIELAEKIGVTASAVANYENEISSPKIEVMYKIFDALKCDANYLYQDEMESSYPLKVSYKEYEHIEKYRYISEQSPEGAHIVNSVLDREYSIAEQLEKQKDRIKELESTQSTVIDIQPYQKDLTRHIYPYLGKIACAGTGFYFDDIPTDTIEAPYVKGADFVIGVNGDSMEPDYHDGEKLYLCKVESLQIGDTGIFTIGNECFLKELGEDGLISRNKDYDDILGNEDIRLVGKVIGKVEI